MNKKYGINVHSEIDPPNLFINMSGGIYSSEQHPRTVI